MLTLGRSSASISSSATGMESKPNTSSSSSATSVSNRLGSGFVDTALSKMAMSHGSIGGLWGAGEVDVLLGGAAVGGASKSLKFQDGTFPDADGGRVTGVDAANGKAFTLEAGLGRNIEFVPVNDIAFTLGAGLERNGTPEFGPAELAPACPQLSKLKASLSLCCFSARS